MHQQQQSVPFHLIYSVEDLCVGDNGCKWCASMKPWLKRNQNKTGSSVINPPKLDVHAPEFVPATGRVVHLTSELYATPPQPNFPSTRAQGGDFRRRIQAQGGSSPDNELKESLHRTIPNASSLNKHQDPFYISQDQSRLEPLRREEARAAIDAKAWELATETFNESLLECVPRILQYSGGILADKAVQKINDCEEVIIRMGQDALEKMLRIKASGHDLPQFNLLLDMRLDTITTILAMKNQEFEVLEAAQARARNEEDALRVEMQNTFHVFNTLENQLQELHREAARLREETAEMRVVVF